MMEEPRRALADPRPRRCSLTSCAASAALSRGSARPGTAAAAAPPRPPPPPRAPPPAAPPPPTAAAPAAAAAAAPTAAAAPDPLASAYPAGTSNHRRCCRCRVGGGAKARALEAAGAVAAPPAPAPRAGRCSPELRVGLGDASRTGGALAVCVGVLRYGLVRTAVALLAARLAADLAGAGLRGVRERLGGAPPNPPTPTTDVE